MSLSIYEGQTSPSQTPYFSVILCSFNRAHLLPRALDSLLAQTELSWEAIVVDDGSTDDTTEVVRRYSQQMPNIRYIYHRNRGLALSRNAGIAAAVGSYVTFLDSDDFFLPDHLAHRRQLIAQNPGVQLLHGGCETIGDPFVPDKYNPTNLLDVRELVVGGTFFMPRDFAVQIGGFPPASRYSEDGDLYERIQALRAHIVKTDYRSYMYDRTTPDSICNIVRDAGLDALLEYRRKGSWTKPSSPRHVAQPAAMEQATAVLI